MIFAYVHMLFIKYKNLKIDIIGGNHEKWKYFWYT